EARELGRKGGKASGEVTRKKADLKRAICIVLSSEVPSSKMAKTLKEMGYENTIEMAMVLSMTQKAIKGDVKAASWI
ncbi:KGG domain-containing protein, partial [Enterococcus faecalis]|uniref:KGG domain-containing protein n=1 Tax=Enterococcus faecalis TaxID=1351 RepID=UPI003D6BDF47